VSPTEGGGDDDDDHHRDEDEAFAEAMRGARPLARGPARMPAPPAVHPRRPTAPSAPAFVVEQTGDTITGRAPDVALKLVRELRGGTPPVQARLDLHGRKRGEALRALERFIATARARGVRAVLVIHGRGHGSEAGAPILRPAIWAWLAGPAAERSGVMAFTSAHARAGGDGATVVLLRRPDR
jgi:DNA-nicking Smr family endonuclease